jgi:hydrogenase nickel incorporation protein HypB
MFRQADLVVITKADTLEFFDFDVEKVKTEARKLKPYVPVILIDNKSKKGFDELVAWIEKKHKEHLEGLN